MQRSRILILTILVMLLCSVSSADTIKIASWNIQDFSPKAFSPEGKNPRDLERVIDILKDYQVIAIQEVETPKIIDLTLARLKDKGYTYDAKVSEKKEGREYYAFLFDTSQIKWSRQAKIYDGKDAKKFLRRPYYATFTVKKGGFDFTLINFHAYYTNRDRRLIEVKTLATVYEIIQDEDKNEQDIILLGDFNLDPTKKTGNYAHEGAYGPLRKITKMVFHPPFISLVSGRGLVDNIFFEKDFTQEYTQTHGITAFEAEDKPSDHYLIWAAFEVPLKDDD